MLVRVRDFGETQSHLFPESSLARDQFATVAAAVKELTEDAVRKMSGKQEGIRTKAMAREALNDRLESIAATARAIARDNPGFEDRFHDPPRSDQGMVTAGRLFARDAELFREQFLAHAMPPTFVSELVQLVDTFERAIRDREAGKGSQTAARVSINAALDSGTAAVQKIDAMVTNHLRDDARATAQWRTARRIGHPRRSRKAKAASPPEPSAVTTVATPLTAVPPPTTSSSVIEKAS